MGPRTIYHTKCTKVNSLSWKFRFLRTHSKGSASFLRKPFSIKVKVKCTLVQAVRLCTDRTVHRGSRPIALAFHDHGTKRGEGLASLPGCSLPPRKTWYPLYMRLGIFHYFLCKQNDKYVQYEVETMTSKSSSYRWPATSWVHYTTSCNTQSSAPENGRDQPTKHVELIGIINKPLLLHLVGVYIIYINDARSNKYQIYIHKLVKMFPPTKLQNYWPF